MARDLQMVARLILHVTGGPFFLTGVEVEHPG